MLELSPRPMLPTGTWDAWDCFPSGLPSVQTPNL